MKEIIFRKEKIVQLCRHKSVFHLGFIQHSHLYEQRIQKKDWLHSHLDKVAKELVGIDYLQKEVELIRKKYGYECYFGDVLKLEELSLNRIFKVIVCGELIEHLENPGMFLDGIKRFMDQNSIIIITTPNPWSKHRIQLIKKGILEDKWINKEHTCWFSFQTLKQILERKGYEEINYSYYFRETEKDLYDRKNIIGKIKSIKHKLLSSYYQERYFNGLFFTAKLKYQI